jgi:phospholipid-translocating ATPase
MELRDIGGSSFSDESHGTLSIWKKTCTRERDTGTGLNKFRVIDTYASRSNIYPPNTIRNQKYSMVSFLPLVLYEQFRYFYNFYFLAISLTQLHEELVVGYIAQYLGPLFFVLALTIAKEAHDDIKRFLRDKEVNRQIYCKKIDGDSVEIASDQIQVGDIIYLQRNQRVPADMVLLHTSERSGAIFLRTDQLDGETDWKLRVAVPETQKISGSNYDRLIVHAEAPHKDIHKFVGSLKLHGSGHGVAEDRNQLDCMVHDPLCNAADMDTDASSLTVENMLWMNTVLASGDAYGFVVYTGKDTRAVLNTSHPRMKLGKLDLEINLFAKVLFTISILLSLIMVSLKHFFGPWLVYLVRYFILFSAIIPLSLKVNLDMARMLYSWFMMKDSMHMQDMIVRNSSIPEELGRVGFLLSDKTGTLTKNDMELKKIHLGTICLNVSDSNEEISGYLDIHVTNGGDSSTLGHSTHHMIRRGKRDMAHRVWDIVQALALCHNVTPSLDSGSDGEITYQASSPDEVAIVRWTEAVGLTLIYRDQEQINLSRESTGEILTFDVIHVFPFTSETKRMGILLRSNAVSASGCREIWFYLKGADTVMAPIVQQNDWLEEEVDNMARDGLRTLVIARKQLSEEALQAFLQKYDQARSSLVDREIKMSHIVSTLLECDMELLGVTGVEDRLQDDVKGTLELLRNAGIRMWMLTGDKVETAACIAISSRLVGRGQSIFQIQRITERAQAIAALQAIQVRVSDHALVIDGISLQTFLDSPQYTKQFLDMATAMSCVVCCRCSPTQKAEIARLIKPYAGATRVCAIGDGGNDVSMIQEAHVGIGIVGKEGRQASLAADFSLSQFSHLSRLLLWHGRNSYKRSAKLGQFVVHRGFIITSIQLVFSALFYFAPIAIYTGIIAAGYATVYTTMPIFSLSLDRDISEYTATMYPELYKELLKGRIMNARTFFTWILVSIYQGGVIMLMAMWLFESELIHIVAITFTALILNELLMVALQINTWHYLMILSEITSIAIYIASVSILPYSFDPVFVTSGQFFWKVTCITIVSFFPLFLVKMVRRLTNPPNYAKLG